MRWKAACGYGLNEAAFHPSALTHWRKRLRESDNPHRINEAVAQVIMATGVLTGRRGRAVDSTVLQDAVARQDTITPTDRRDPPLRQDHAAWGHADGGPCDLV